MNQYKTLGVVLNYKVVNENDRLYTLYTENYGKISLLAVGSSKIQSKLSGHLDRINLVEVVFVSEHQNRLISALVKESFLNIKKRLKSLNAAFSILNLLEELTLFGQKDPNIYELLINSLYFLEENVLKLEEVADFIPFYFNAQLLNNLGVAPYLDGCVICGTTLNTNFFSFEDKGLVCFKHRKNATLKLDRRKRKILEILFNNPLAKFKKPLLIIEIAKEKKFLKHFFEEFTLKIKSAIM